MSAEQAPKRRNSSIIDRSPYAPGRPQGDDRRRNLDALGQDRAATERAKQDMAEIARQQRGHTHAPVQLDDLEVQERKPLRMVAAPAPLPAAPTPGADMPSQSVDDQRATPEPQMSAATAQPIQPAAVATTKKVHASAPVPAARIRFEHVEHASDRLAAPARPMPTAHTAAYPRDEHYAPHDVYHYWEAPIALARNNPLLLLILVALICVPVIGMLSQSPKTFISSYNGAPFGDTVTNVVNGLLFNQETDARNLAANVPVGEHSVVGAPSITADDVDAVLAQYNSPAHGTGKIWIELGKKYGIDPAYALAFFIHESSAGTNPRWDGMKSDGSTTHNIGNISCAGYPRCLGRWRDYGSWDEGIEDWYRVIHDEYVEGRGVQTVEQIMPIYAPSFENDVNTYVQTVVTLVDGWRQQGVAR